MESPTWGDVIPLRITEFACFLRVLLFEECFELDAIKGFGKCNKNAG
jgi:hypothetical protein